MPVTRNNLALFDIAQALPAEVLSNSLFCSCFAVGFDLFDRCVSGPPFHGCHHLLIMEHVPPWLCSQDVLATLVPVKDVNMGSRPILGRSVGADADIEYQLAEAKVE